MKKKNRKVHLGNSPDILTHFYQFRSMKRKNNTISAHSYPVLLKCKSDSVNLKRDPFIYPYF